MIRSELNFTVDAINPVRILVKAIVTQFVINKQDNHKAGSDADGQSENIDQRKEALLAQIARVVMSVERIKPLHELAKTNLRPLRIANIRLHYGDGMLGFPQVAPFDGIILAAAGLEVPQTLLEQMTIGGRLVAPVGSRHQVLQLIERVGRREWTTTELEDCHFVPLRPGTVG